MPKLTRPLTAQEALEKEKWILIMADYECVGRTLEVKDPLGAIPLGACVMVLEEISRKEAAAYCERVGWSTYRNDLADHFYKAIAE
jgi:hypothetical protein